MCRTSGHSGETGRQGSVSSAASGGNTEVPSAVVLRNGKGGNLSEIKFPFLFLNIILAEQISKVITTCWLSTIRIWPSAMYCNIDSENDVICQLCTVTSVDWAPHGCVFVGGCGWVCAWVGGPLVILLIFFAVFAD